MAVLIDPPAWPAHGRLWSHLASDVSYAELHAFATTAGVSARAFEGDHYDVPQQRYTALVAAGASPVASRDLLRALQVSGLRRPKRKGELVLHRWLEGGPSSGGSAPRQVDLLLSPLGPPAPAATTYALAVRGERIALVQDDLPVVRPQAGVPVGYLRLRQEVPREITWLALRRASVREVSSSDIRWATRPEVRASRVWPYWWALLDRLFDGPPSR